MTLPDVSLVESAGTHVLLVHGSASIEAYDTAIDDLARRCDAPVTGRWAWLRAAIDQAGVEASACLLTAADGDLCAATVFVHHLDETGVRHVRLASGGDGHRAVLLAVDADAARSLGAALAETLASVDGPLRVELGSLPAGDLTLRALQDALPDAALSTTTDVIPSVRSVSGDIADHLSRGMLRTLRKSHNRLASDGVVAEFTTTGDPDEIIARLPDVAAVSRERDHAGGRASVFDSEAGRHRWMARMTDLARLCHLELNTLSLDGEPAAYVLGLQDGRTYRLIEGRFVMAWKRYSPGRLLEADVLERVLHDPRLDELDWMTSVAPESLLAANAGTDVVSVDLAL